MAAVAIIEATAKMRLSRGDGRDQIANIERSEHVLGDLIDIWIDQPNKDPPRLRGPAQISSVNTGENNVIVRFQGKTLDRRHQEIRAHVPYLAFLSSMLDHNATQWSIMQKEIEALPNMFMTMGVVHSNRNWHIAPHTHKHGGRRPLDAALALASQMLHLDLVSTTRACRIVAPMPTLKPYAYGAVVAWCRGAWCARHNTLFATKGGRQHETSCSTTRAGVRRN